VFGLFILNPVLCMLRLFFWRAPVVPGVKSSQTFSWKTTKLCFFPTAHLGESTTANSKSVPPDDFDDGRRPEMAILPFPVVSPCLSLYWEHCCQASGARLRFVLWILMLSVVLSDILPYPVWRSHCCFRFSVSVAFTCNTVWICRGRKLCFCH